MMHDAEYNSMLCCPGMLCGGCDDGDPVGVNGNSKIELLNKIFSIN